MDDGHHSKAIPPRCREVADAHARVLVGGALGPSQQCLLGGHVVGLANHDVGNLGGENYKSDMLNIFNHNT